jgi:RNA polymerase sigma-70 factor, ECF subfamily
MQPAPPERIDRDPYQNGDDHRLWLHATFERLERPLIAYAMRLLGGNVDTARDCVQESFLRLCRESRSHVEGHVDAWLFKTCRNRAMDHHRQEARMMIDSNASALATVKAPASEPMGYLAQREEQEELHDQIAKLPTREQEVLSLRLAQGLSYKQIAEVTDMSVSHVGVILHDAVSKLRTAMASTKRLQPSLHPKP